MRRAAVAAAQASLEGVRIAFDAIVANKVRAALTILGVAVGVFVVVAMAATIQGVRRSFQTDLDAFGANAFMVRRTDVAFNQCDDGENCPARRFPTISMREWRAIDALPSVGASSPWLSGSTNVRYRATALEGVNLESYGPAWLATDGGDIAPGRNFTPSENERAAPVAILNDTLAKILFGTGDPLGRIVALNGQRFEVIGVYQTTAGFLKSFDGRGPETPKVVVPVVTARQRLNVWMRGMMITVKPRDGVPRDVAMDEVTATLRAMRGLRPAEPSSFYLVGQDKLASTFNTVFGALFLVMLVLSAVGLLVGGVGVVAIMMISVTERTREIGVRKALGATRRTILWQFLVEGATLTTLGASVGLALGALVAAAIRTWTPIPAAVPLPAVVAALAASALTGIAFGMAPASRAARLDPVEALRHE